MRHVKDTFIGLSTWKYKLIFFLCAQFATWLLYQTACRFQNIQLDANNNNIIDVISIEISSTSWLTVDEDFHPQVDVKGRNKDDDSHSSSKRKDAKSSDKEGTPSYQEERMQNPKTKMTTHAHRGERKKSLGTPRTKLRRATNRRERSMRTMLRASLSPPRQGEKLSHLQS